MTNIKRNNKKISLWRILPNVIDSIYILIVTLAQFYAVVMIFSGLYIFAVLFPSELLNGFSLFTNNQLKTLITTGVFVRAIVRLFTFCKFAVIAADININGIKKVHIIKSASVLFWTFIIYCKPDITIDKIFVFLFSFIAIILIRKEITDSTMINNGHFKSYNCKENREKICVQEQKEEKEWYKHIQNTTKCHEAGHAVMAELLGFKVNEISIEKKEGSCGRVVFDVPPIVTPKELEKIVKILYSGYMAEKLYLNEVTTSCMGGEYADLETANRHIKKYIILTDTNISLTGYEEEYIKSKSIEISEKWLDETKILLEDNMDKLRETIENFDQYVCRVNSM